MRHHFCPARRTLILLASVAVAAGLACGDGNEPENVGNADAGADVDERTLWVPEPGMTWQWQLQGAIQAEIDVDMYDVDLFDVREETVSKLHSDGRMVICNFSAGTYEDWRPDAQEFVGEEYGNERGEWPGEFWLDIRRDSVRDRMQDRLDLAVEKGCDGVEPDNVDGWLQESGFELTREEQVAYNRFLATAAHERKLSVGLRNAVALIEDLESYFDWTLNEQCLEYMECDQLQPFVDAGKPVFHVEYVDDEDDGPLKRDEICNLPEIEEFSTLIKLPDASAWLMPCE